MSTSDRWLSQIPERPIGAKRAVRSAIPKPVAHFNRDRKPGKAERLARHEAHMRARRPRGNGRGRASMSGAERRAASLKGWETQKVREESE